MKHVMKKLLSVSLVVLMLLGTLAMTACSGAYDYADEDMSEFIDLSDESLYSGFKIKPVYVKPVDDKAVWDAIYSKFTSLKVYTLATDKKAEVGEYDDIYFTNQAVAENDFVYIYYVGYTDVDGVMTPFEGGCNFSAATPTELRIGSDAFIDGFEDKLIGLMPKKDSFASATTGTTKAGDKILASYKTSYTNALGKTVTNTATKTYIVLDLTNPAFDSTVVKKLTGATVGSSLNTFNVDGVKVETQYTTAYVYDIVEEDGKYYFEADPDWHSSEKDVAPKGKFEIKDFDKANLEKEDEKFTVTLLEEVTVNYSSVKVDAVLTTVTQSIDVTFPEDYNTASLAGKDATFEVCILGTSRVNSAIIKDYFNFETDETEESKVIAAYAEKTEEDLVEAYDKQRMINVINAIWTEAAPKLAKKISGYPEKAINDFESEYIENLKYNYYMAGAKDETASTGANSGTKYASFADYAAATLNSELGITAVSANNYKQYVTTLAQERVGERVVVFGLAQKLGVTVTDKDYDDRVAQLEAENAWTIYYYQLLGYNISDIFDMGYTEEGITYGLYWDKVMEKLHENYMNDGDYTDLVEWQGVEDEDEDGEEEEAE